MQQVYAIEITQPYKSIMQSQKNSICLLYKWVDTTF